MKWLKYYIIMISITIIYNIFIFFFFTKKKKGFKSIFIFEAFFYFFKCKKILFISSVYLILYVDMAHKLFML